MKVYAINGSPHKHGNTAQALDAFLEGVHSIAPNTESHRVDLYRYDFQGCHACFACKLKNKPSYGHCTWSDAIHDVLDDVAHADIVVFGSPIYFGHISGEMRCFLERLLYPFTTYSKDVRFIAPRTIHTAWIYTMNVTEEIMKESGYDNHLTSHETFCGNVFGHAPTRLVITDTMQFNDYRRYVADRFDPKAKARRRASQFPEDLARARALGSTLAERAMQD